jgi:phage tail protein X
MATTIRTSDGDVLDSLCYVYYGRLAGVVEAVLAANPGLADQPQPFASGVLIVLPDISVQSQATVILWE